MASDVESAKIRHPKKRAMIAALSETGVISMCAKIADIDRSTHYEWLRADPEYAAAVEDALETAADRLEEEARRRAHDGWEEPVFYQGVECGRVRKFSDTLLIFKLKAMRPEKFRDRSSVIVEDPTKALAKMLGVSPEEIPA